MFLLSVCEREQSVLAHAGARRLLWVGDAAKDWDARFAEDVLDDCFAEAGSVVIEMKQVCFLVEAELLETVGISKIPERAELLGPKLFLELVGNGHEGHGEL